MTDISGYRHDHDGLNELSNQYVLPTVLEIVGKTAGLVPDKSLFDLGCGNGAVANEMAKRGFRVSGVDPSTEGIDRASINFPGLDLHSGSAYDDLKAKFGTFSYVLSLEVVEHLYDPRSFARSVFDLLKPGGYAIISTPYHGYWKNLAIAVAGGFDFHFTALWDHGHIKFWSIPSLTSLLEEANLQLVEFYRVGRIPALAKSMIAVARKP